MAAPTPACNTTGVTRTLPFTALLRTDARTSPPQPRTPESGTHLPGRLPRRWTRRLPAQAVPPIDGVEAALAPLTLPLTAPPEVHAPTSRSQLDPTLTATSYLRSPRPQSPLDTPVGRRRIHECRPVASRSSMVWRRRHSGVQGISDRKEGIPPEVAER